MLEFDKKMLEELLPHRGIALVIDGLEYDLEKPDFITGKKILKENDPHFTGHFPGNHIFPGHWSIEAMALTAATLIKLSRIKLQDAYPYFLGVEKFDFKRPIKPGDEIRISVQLLETEEKRNIFTFLGEVVNQKNKIVATGTIRGTIATKI